MASSKSTNNGENFEATIRDYLKQGKEKLDKELTGTKEAIKIIAVEKTREFIKVMDKGLAKEERDFLSAIIVSCMCQSFCYGYGIGKIEGNTNKKVYL